MSAGVRGNHSVTKCTVTTLDPGFHGSVQPEHQEGTFNGGCRSIVAKGGSTPPAPY